MNDSGVFPLELMKFSRFYEFKVYWIDISVHESLIVFIFLGVRYLKK